MIPAWIHLAAIACLAVGFLSAGIIAVDESAHPQHMWIMNAVWPVTALFGTVVVLWAYFCYGRLATRERALPAMKQGKEPPSKTMTPFPMMVAKGTLHCGAGCTLGDIVAEWLAFALPVVAIGFGWKSLFGMKLFAVWIVDYLFAFALGIAFQYFTIAPVRHLSAGEGLVAAFKADALSLTAWQVGMYGFMAFAQLYLFRHVFGADLAVDTPEFWFMMQIAMLFGFATAYPVNWILIRSGLKERM